MKNFKNKNQAAAFGLLATKKDLERIESDRDLLASLFQLKKNAGEIEYLFAMANKIETLDAALEAAAL